MAASHWSQAERGLVAIATVLDNSSTPLWTHHYLCPDRTLVLFNALSRLPRIRRYSYTERTDLYYRIRPIDSGMCAQLSSLKGKSKMLGKDLEAKEELQQEEHLDAQERFEILSDLGGGAYGTVYKARDKGRGGEIVALKKVSVREDPEIGIPPFVMREVANLKRLSQDKREPHIVRYVWFSSVCGEIITEATLVQ